MRYGWTAPGYYACRRSLCATHEPLRQRAVCGLTVTRYSSQVVMASRGAQTAMRPPAGTSTCTRAYYAHHLNTHTRGGPTHCNPCQRSCAPPPSPNANCGTIFNAPGVSTARRRRAHSAAERAQVRRCDQRQCGEARRTGGPSERQGAELRTRGVAPHGRATGIIVTLAPGCKHW